MHPPSREARFRSPLIALATTAAFIGSLAAGCEAGAVPPTPPILPGTTDHPREVNIITKDYLFLPPGLDLAPGETVLFHIVNGGLVVHEAIIGDMKVQQAWEDAEAPFAEPPPGPTPAVTVPAGVDGFRVVVQSGERKDVRWTVPTSIGDPLILGCHIPGHWAKGMQAPVRLVVRGASPGPATSPSSPVQPPASASAPTAP